MRRELCQFLGAIECVEADASGIGALDRRHLLNGVSETDRCRFGSGVETHLDLLDAGGIEPAVEADQPLQDGRRWICLHSVINLRQWQGAR